MFNSYTNEICHKDILMFTAISLITHCDQWVIGQVYFDPCIKYILVPSPRDFPREQNLCSAIQVTLGVRFFKINQAPLAMCD